ncbi:NADH-quinone oxidoreductase subunit NuoF family protein [Streptosporangium lutulentum]|uniref:NADH:ubiquinone oxidoreductase subunit F (NADH-binding)/ferredoxin n=1 Tax=Streptosporangium lutulentum TaxID=1461250 RepID=A0ABT9QKF5_9ACTN|nr:NADH-quinone oxidoreductase subunit NuoF family protein [Streptosporangium lutulentum]MDP9846399.1 NADH:ubiquinone oxidoreductase subunit F (NADH-binding)/ferredoxin [Streptosporangium lutulentum]
MIPYRVPPVRQLGPARLTAGLEDRRRMDLAAHRAMHGTAASMSAEELAALADEVDLRGRGGAAFPFARKLRAVMDKRSEKVVLVNAAEGEPASSKDTMLLTRTPHLVIEGALLAAGAINAKRIVIAAVKGGMGESSIAAAVEERGVGDRVRVVGIVERFISGEGGALVRSVNGLVGEPPGRKVRAVESGVSGLPTLLSNAETFAQLAVLATLGSERYADVGTAREPGTVLLTVGGSAKAPAVVEVATGTPLYAVLDACQASLGEGVLLGGYHGGWLHPDAAVVATVSRQGITDAGGQLGAGIIVPLGAETCPLGETARVAKYLAEQSSGQCGPCRLGLPDVARSMAEIVNGSAAALDELRHRAAGVKGRGACFHPDGTSRFVLSALGAFPDDIEEHILNGTCGRPVQGMLPLPPQENDPEVRLTVDWTRCQGHGLCAKLAPDLIHLDEHGYPVLSREAVPNQFRRMARRTVEMCPALALRVATG